MYLTGATSGEISFYFISKIEEPDLDGAKELTGIGE
jgi:hypothetical protein